MAGALVRARRVAPRGRCGGECGGARRRRLSVVALFPAHPVRRVHYARRAALAAHARGPRDQVRTYYLRSVGDADGFRLYHTPGLPLLRSWWHRVPTQASELRRETISVRLAGADAPEAAHFGREGQPFADEARAELRRLIEGRTVWLDMAHIDQYQRLVGVPYVWRWPYVWGRTNVSLALVRRGLATVYRSAGAAYGSAGWLSRWLLHASSGRAAFERAEEHARRCRLGMWSLGRKLETPGAYKHRMR